MVLFAALGMAQRPPIRLNLGQVIDAMQEMGAGAIIDPLRVGLGLQPTFLFEEVGHRDIVAMTFGFNNLKLAVKLAAEGVDRPTDTEPVFPLLATGE
jgi:hypothetical protein